MRSVKAEQSQPRVAESQIGQPVPCFRESYLERLGIVYLDQIRLTIVTELYMRAMSVNQFYETIGGSSYDSVRRHFFRLVEFGWLQYVKTAPAGRGAPEKLYRSTELAVIDTETWRTLPFSIRDAFTVQLLEEMGGRIGEALKHGSAHAKPNAMSVFKLVDVDERAWHESYASIERCFHTILRKQSDAKIRLEGSHQEPLSMVVNLAAFEAPGPLAEDESGPLPKARPGGSDPPTPWPQRVGKVFSDRLDISILNELNRDARTPVQLREALGGGSSDTFLRHCRRLTDLGWAVCVDTLSGGPLYGAEVSHFRAAAPDVTEADIYRRIPRTARSGTTWDAFQRFIATSISAVGTGTFNHRTDRHLTMSPLLLDECGWRQVTNALKTFEQDLIRIEKDLGKRRRGRKGGLFPAAFLISGVDSPLREVRR